MAFNVGLNVVEVDGSASAAIVGAAVSVAGFNILTERGVPNRPTRVTRFSQFVEQFGGFFGGGYGAYLVKGFFDNGGQTAYINRVVGAGQATGHRPASRDLNAASSQVATLRLEAGQRGSVDPGSWGNRLFVRVTPSASTHPRETAKASLQGNPLAAATDLSGGTTLTVTVDGEPLATAIVLNAGDFTAPAAVTREQIRDVLNGKTSKLVASLSADNRLVLTSSGEVAKQRKRLTRLVVAANATLGLAAGNADGQAVAPAAGGAILASTDGFAVGDDVRLVAGNNRAFVKLTTVDRATGAVTWTPDVANLGNFPAASVVFETAEFDLEIASGAGEKGSVVEEWRHLSMESARPNYAQPVLNHELRGSRYLVVTDLAPANTADRRPAATTGFLALGSGAAEAAAQAAVAGRDGMPGASDFTGDEVRRTGFYAFDPIDLQLLGCERMDAAVVGPGIDYCGKRGDCIFVGSVREGLFGNGVDEAVAYGKTFQGKKVYGALYGPWIRVLDPLASGAAPYKWVPPTGHVMGTFARIETNRGIWKAPAGDEARLVGALDVEYQMSDVEHTALVKEGSVNGIRAVAGAGIVIDASRTLSTDTRWLYVNVRLLFNYVKSSLKAGLRWARQEPNRDSLWDAIKFGSVTPFLMGLWRQGAFGTGKPEEVFTVICDAGNNPPDQVDQGNLKLEVYFYPSRPAETIVIVVGQQASGASASEA